MNLWSLAETISKPQCYITKFFKIQWLKTSFILPIILQISSLVQVQQGSLVLVGLLYMTVISCQVTRRLVGLRWLQFMSAPTILSSSTTAWSCSLKMAGIQETMEYAKILQYRAWDTHKIIFYTTHWLTKKEQGNYRFKRWRLYLTF